MSKEQHNSNELSLRRNRSFQVWKNLDRWNVWATRERRFQMMALLGSVAVALIVIASFVSSRYSGTSARTILGVLILLIFFIVLFFASLVFLEILRLLRRHRSTGPTQRRLVTLFVMMALVPTILVAVFSTITMNVGMENWFSNRVKNVVDNSYAAALAYSQEHDQAIQKEGDLVFLSFKDNYETFKNSPLTTQITEDQNGEPTSALFGALRENLNVSVAPVSETVKQAFIISSIGEIISRGTGSYLFNFNPPSKSEITSAFAGERVIIKDLGRNEFRYLRAIDPNLGYYLYLTREVDGRILGLLNETEETSKFYRDSENNRQKLLIWFGIFYLTVAIVILMLAIWAALYFAARLTRPISQLVRTVERISEGDLDARVMEMEDDDEFALLSRSFNQMTSEVQSNQLALKRAGDVSEAESRKFNNVLEGVSSGVIGVDGKGKITFINSSAMQLLDISKINKSTQINTVAPEFAPIIEQLENSDTSNAQEQISLLRGGSQETLFVRVSRSERRRSGNMIISFDVVSDLVQAQRMAAWGDVARRIAHEIKNPLTPIRLSAERLKRRFGKEIMDDRDKFEELTDIIVRQTEDLRRIVDEFSKFSRMPEAIRKKGNWIAQLKSSIALQQQNEDGVEIVYNGPEKVLGFFDEAMMGQVFTNIMKNGIEAIASRKQREGLEHGIIQINGTLEHGQLQITFCDNGMGFPTDKTRLFEPYMTFKETGTGLGLPIVKKIVEDHEGKISLLDRPDGEKGACVQIKLTEHEALNSKQK